jgi:hypothetical protein
MHAQLILQDNKIFIKDSKSKFGTLILVQNPYQITEKTVSLQIGRTYLECSLIDMKEYERIKKELAVAALEKSQGMKNKPLFRKIYLIFRS